MSAGTFRGAGHYANGWSSHSGNITSNAYYLEIFTAVEPSLGPNQRWFGFPLRCLSTVLGMGEELLLSSNTTNCYGISKWFIGKPHRIARYKNSVCVH